jgi:hypothetical protein
MNAEQPGQTECYCVKHIDKVLEAIEMLKEMRKQNEQRLETTKKEIDEIQEQLLQLELESSEDQDDDDDDEETSEDDSVKQNEL